MGTPPGISTIRVTYARAVPLLLLDLDNTLIDRAAAFRRWAEIFVAQRNGAPDDLDWLIAADGDGFVARDELAMQVTDHFKLDATSTAPVIATLQRGVVEHMEADPEVLAAVDDAADQGWTPVIITNGMVTQQERKIRKTGIHEHVASWVISEGAGVSKPDPRIFEIASEQAGQDLDGAWMVGDSAEADIAGAHACGLSSVWLHRGRTWTHAHFAPTTTADSCAAAIEGIVAGDQVG